MFSYAFLQSRNIHRVWITLFKHGKPLGISLSLVLIYRRWSAMIWEWSQETNYFVFCDMIADIIHRRSHISQTSRRRRKALIADIWELGFNTNKEFGHLTSCSGGKSSLKRLETCLSNNARSRLGSVHYLMQGLKHYLSRRQHFHFRTIV